MRGKGAGKGGKGKGEMGEGKNGRKKVRR